MSSGTYVDRQKHQKKKNYKQQNQKIQPSSQQEDNEIEKKSLIISQKIQKSTYFLDQEFQDDDSKNQPVKKLSNKIYSSQYGTEYYKSELQPIKAKIESKNVQTKMIIQPIAKKEYKNQKYESISSDECEDQEQQKKVYQNIENFSKRDVSSDKYDSILKESLGKKHTKIYQTENALKNNSQGQGLLLVGYDDMQSFLKKNSYPDQPHTTFNLDEKKIQLKSSLIQINQHRLLKASQKKAYNSHNKDFQKLSQRQIKQNKAKKQIKYPSIVLSSVYSQNRVKGKKQKIDEFESLNYLNSSKNEVLTLKKMSSEDSFKKGESKYQFSDEQIQDQKAHSIMKINQDQRLLDKKNMPDTHISSEFDLFYFSASRQDLYPSLDLKNNTSKIKPILDQDRSSATKQDRLGQINQAQNKLNKINHQPKICRIKILDYHSQYFLQIQTQIFSIQVEYFLKEKKIKMENQNQKQSKSDSAKSPLEKYEINRRFSDFVFLYEGIMTNHLGYIIYPFPEKSLQSFMKIKLQSIIGSALPENAIHTEAEKVQLIQKRIEQLQKFVNFLLEHEQLQNSQQLAIFLCENSQIYLRQRSRIQKYIEQYKQLQSSGNLIQSSKKNIKKVLNSGFQIVKKWWSSPDTKEDINQKVQKSKQSQQVTIVDSTSQSDLEFKEYSQKIAICFAKFQLLQKSMQKLLMNQKRFIQFRDIDTELDYLIKMSTKFSSGKQYCRKIEKAIEVQLISQISTGAKWLKQAKLQIQKREQLKTLIETLKLTLTNTNDISSKISKLQRRLQRFEKNFRFGFSNLIITCSTIFQSTKLQFLQNWKLHARNMRKIWK